ncbi:HPF/RaiA family ribosome-associated protein [Pseudotabrizicola sp.]|jgi:ribosome-associated translation inhibitor RaiA|uniref:HPF/RaiA family ribosome-associated protein n=1 Tax=Pseudotabrizicola sp. TaxID=2939647 RepID=UPI002721E7A5|nr:HPF/RaiA family ribosome-associated protein [Pseudotabrizicola sp.]MDO8883189.1 HPF/RaiA family ribosome-associated protein [Pseudotabrizicola sp.]
MQIIVNTDDKIEGNDAMLDSIRAQVDDALSRFADQITRAEVHLSDENGAKGGGEDNRCLLEVRPSGQQPVAVTHQAASPQEACDGALQKMVNKLQSTFGRQTNAKGGHSIRDLDPI